MNCTLSKVIIFIAGAAIGSAVTWKLTKTKYDKLVQEEIDSVKEVFSNMPRDYICEDDGGEDVNEDATDNQTMTVEEFLALDKKPDIHEYAAKLQGEGYVNYSKPDAEEVEDNMERPYVISPDEYDEFDDYSAVSLTYYADGVLADDMDEMVEDVDNVVGLESLNHFGQYEDDSVFVRNDRLRCDYEILLDVRNYSDVIKSNPHPAEDE